MTQNNAFVKRMLRPCLPRTTTELQTYAREYSVCDEQTYTNRGESRLGQADDFAGDDIDVDLIVGGAGGQARDGGEGAHEQGLTLVHFSAQLERFVWDRGCA